MNPFCSNAFLFILFYSFHLPKKRKKNVELKFDQNQMPYLSFMLFMISGNELVKSYSFCLIT